MVVSNTSPIANLAVIGRLDILRQLYGVLLIPDAVRQELAAAAAVESAVAAADWVEQRCVRDRRLVESLGTQLHPGEAEAIALAIEQEAELLLMDERRGRRIASELSLRRVGVLGVLLEAKSKEVVPAVRPLLDALVAQAGFWIGRKLYARVLAEAGES